MLCSGTGRVRPAGVLGLALGWTTVSLEPAVAPEVSVRDPVGGKQWSLLDLCLALNHPSVMLLILSQQE